MTERWLLKMFGVWVIFACEAWLLFVPGALYAALLVVVALMNTVLPVFITYKEAQLFFSWREEKKQKRATEPQWSFKGKICKKDAERKPSYVRAAAFSLAWILGCFVALVAVSCLFEFWGLPHRDIGIYIRTCVGALVWGLMAGVPAAYVVRVWRLRKAQGKENNA